MPIAKKQQHTHKNQEILKTQILLETKRKFHNDGRSIHPEDIKIFTKYTSATAPQNTRSKNWQN